jgi:hypothetical protein
VLLIATMLRLALNLASTRLILSNGHEGPMPPAGDRGLRRLRDGGNFVIGIIVFAILVIVNFVVITKGSGRIAEVAARFTLDAMPGKQMAIDADLSAGLIDEDEARDPPQAIWRSESSFYGAMDGASKFVRGDAIAGLLITFINVIGGMIIGIAQMDLSASAKRPDLHPADRRRRPGLPDPGADRLHRGRLLVSKAGSRPCAASWLRTWALSCRRCGCWIMSSLKPMITSSKSRKSMQAVALSIPTR